MPIYRRPFATQRTALLSLCILAISLLAVYLHQKDGRETMDIAKADSILDTHIPPIDKAVPVKVETATFALG
jgi:hypothetical protein